MVFSSYIFGVLLSSASFSYAGVLPKRSISATQYNTISLYEQYAAASYCPANDGGSPGTPITCSVGNCPQVQAANATIVLGIATSTNTDTASFVSVDHVNNIVAVSFRGTESARQYLVDLDNGLTDIPTCTGCEGFKGIYRAWSEVRSQIKAAVTQAIKANPGYTVLTTGHSLGAGIATFAAAELRQAGFTVDLATYAGPRVGNLAFVNYVMAQEPSQGINYRVIHTGDPVANAPSRSSGYYHISPNYYITSGNDVAPTADQIVMQTGTDFDEPNTNGGSAAHDFYFNKISSCYPSACEICIPWK